MIIIFVAIVSGHSIVAASSSIPTKFQTIVTDNSDKKGFMTKAKRFKDDSFMVSIEHLKSVAWLVDRCDL